MHSCRSIEGSGQIIKGLVSFLILVIFAFGLQLGQAYGGTVTLSYSGEMPMNDGAPVRIAKDPTTGHIYVTSPLLGKISEYDANGDFIVDITGFAEPLSIAADGNSHLFVGDSEDGSVRVLDLSANILYFLGAGAGEFGIPGDIAVSQSGLVFVTDSSNDRVRVYTAANGNYQFSFGIYGSGNGQFKFPTGIACDDANQEVYVVDQNNGRVQVFNFSGAYKRPVGSFGAGNGRLTRPQGVFVKDGFVYVADAYQSTVEVFKTDGTFVTFVGEYGSGAGQLRIPMDVAVSDSTLFVVNSDNLRIELFDISYFYSISGSVKTSSGSGVPNVLVTLSGDANRTATTDSIGNYTINNLTPGSYTLAPSAAGFALTSPLDVVLTTADLAAQNFTVSSYSVSGTVTISSGKVLAGVALSLTGTNTNGGAVTKAATTNTVGAYSFTDLLPGNYTVTPSKAGYAFTPASVIVSNANVTQNFVVQVYTISGAVTTGGGAGISGISVGISIGTTKKTATTVATTGIYTIIDVPVGSYTVTPTKANYCFTPANQAVTVSSSNLTGVNFNSYSLSGTVKSSNTIAISGVLMTLSGGSLMKNLTATTGATGAYTFAAGLCNGTYTLTPSKAGYTFTPATVIINSADVTQNFTVQVYSISGAVTTGSGAGVSGVVMTITIGITKKTATTAVSTGAYTITEVPVGSYTVTPTKANYCFTPLNQNVTLNTAAVTGVNFNSFTLSGSVKSSNNVAISGVLMTLSGGSLTKNLTATTGATGAYTFVAGLCNGTYTLTPSKAGYTFTPATVIVSGADVTQNFVVQVYTISGSVKTGANVGISAVSVAVYIGGVKKTATTALTTGDYTITEVPVGSYTVTPNKTNYCFTPAAKVVTISSSNVIQNFTGAVCGTTAMNIIAAAKGPDVTNDALVRVLDLSGNLISEFQTLTTFYGAKVATGDLLGDGSYELIVTPGKGSSNTALMKIYGYNGTLLASLASIADTAYGASVVAGDIDGDGKDEIVMSRLASDMMTHTISIYSVSVGYVMTQDATISFVSSAPVTAPANVAVGDLDGAGALELIVSYMSGDGATNTVKVYTFDAYMNPTLRGSNNYPLGSTVSAMNPGGGATEDIVIGYTDGIDSIVKGVDINFAQVVAPVIVLANGGSAPTLSTMDINGDGTLDLLAGMGDQPANPATLKIYTSGGSPVNITAFDSSARGVNADFGIIKR